MSGRGVAAGSPAGRSSPCRTRANRGLAPSSRSGRGSPDRSPSRATPDVREPPALELGAAAALERRVVQERRASLGQSVCDRSPGSPDRTSELPTRSRPPSLDRGRTHGDVAFVDHPVGRGIDRRACRPPRRSRRALSRTSSEPPRTPGRSGSSASRPLPRSASRSRSPLRDVWERSRRLLGEAAGAPSWVSTSFGSTRQLETQRSNLRPRCGPACRGYAGARSFSTADGPTHWRPLNGESGHPGGRARPARSRKTVPPPAPAA